MSEEAKKKNPNKSVKKSKATVEKAPKKKSKATAEKVRQLTDGKIDTAGFMRLIKNSIETL